MVLTRLHVASCFCEAAVFNGAACLASDAVRGAARATVPTRF
ncbi:MAG: hypothetical protein GAK40_01351 [Burkholderia plantarii]|nr:MAG: hypothetical protein GAK40_01351 [Burkholderia plantarii]